jgi:hypothetical protein
MQTDTLKFKTSGDKLDSEIKSIKSDNQVMSIKTASTLSSNDFRKSSKDLDIAAFNS